MIHRLGEEALNLRSMQVHRHNAVRTRHFNGIRAHARTDGNARFVLFIALCIAEIRHDDGNGVRACTLCSINVEQQLHKLIVCVESDGLNEVYIHIADALIKAHIGVSLGKMNGRTIAHRAAEVIAHFLRELLACAARKDLDVSVSAKHNIQIPLSMVFRQNPASRPPPPRVYQNLWREATHAAMKMIGNSA